MIVTGTAEEKTTILKNYHGYKCTTVIDGDAIEDAKIAVEGNIVYICQNIRNGYDAANKLGYDYSWQLATTVADVNVTVEEIILAYPYRETKWQTITKIEELYDKHEAYFEAEINGKFSSGKVNVEEPSDVCIYLCQNTNDGTSCTNKMGYLYSYFLAVANLNKTVKNLKIKTYEINRNLSTGRNETRGKGVRSKSEVSKVAGSKRLTGNRIGLKRCLPKVNSSLLSGTICAL